MSVQEHKQEAPRSICCQVITVSDTRDINTDKSGQLIIQFLEEHGHVVGDYLIVKDEKKEIHHAVTKGCELENIDCILINGGTGIAKRDVTIETVEKLFDKKLVGFGELFRMLSFTKDIGSSAILSRATAGVINDTVLFSMPGSSGAVKLAMTELIIPEIGHVIREVRKDQ